MFAVFPFPNTGYVALEILVALAELLAIVLAFAWLTTRYIPNQQVGVVEKLWSNAGSVPEGRIIALDGEAGYQADLLRGGLHYGLWRWQYRVHKVPLVTIPQGKIGYIYARDGESLPPSQTLGRVVNCNNFQDARTFLCSPSEEGTASVCGQRGRQRAILREGVYAINPALFVVITEDAVYRLSMGGGARELQTLMSWQQELRRVDGFSPVVVGASMRVREAAAVEDAEDAEDAPRQRKRGRVVGAPIPEAPVPLDVEAQRDVDTIAIVSVQDGPSLLPGEIIAPSVGNDNNDPNYHNN
jgi:hypothetical protein